MGMYHYVYSPKEKPCLYVDKTAWKRLHKTLRLNSYYLSCRTRLYDDAGPMDVRAGILLQSRLRDAGFVERRLKPIRYRYSWQKNSTFFFGHTYIDTRSLPLLEKFAEVDQYLSDMLCELLRARPGRWRLFGDDMLEPKQFVKGTRMGTLHRNGKYTLDSGADYC